MDSACLRDVLRPLVVALKDLGTHDVLPTICQGLGLPTRSCEGSKREKIGASFDGLCDAELPRVAERFLQLYPPSPCERNKLQDILWADTTAPEIPKRFRREVARTLAIDGIFLDAQRFDALLDRLWVLDDHPVAFLCGGVDRSLRAAICQHVHRNPGDWSAEELFDRLGAFDASDRRFLLFLEGLASSDVRPDEAAQRRFVELVNTPLRGCGVEMRESDTEGGYPVFRVVSTYTAPTGRPKNLIFASPVKPDLRFRDAVNNDVEIVTNEDKVLVYDRPISIDGLRWRDLQSWWSETQRIPDDEEAKRTLYLRLRDSLPMKSPPQLLLFDAFYRGFGSAVPDLPALLPEVWLHWDPKTARQRGPLALLRFRMDFLLLLPHGVRVVLEVDGKHHYASDDGRADCARYATMVAADRELKLAGYHVFRFGAQELQEDAARGMVKEFFDALFRRLGVTVPPSGKPGL
jgi:very-short-patch-repair endonuclease